MGLNAERATGDSIRIIITDGRSSFDTIESDADVKTFVDQVDEILAGDPSQGAHVAPSDPSGEDVAPDPPA